MRPWSSRSSSSGSRGSRVSLLHSRSPSRSRSRSRMRRMDPARAEDLSRTQGASPAWHRCRLTLFDLLRPSGGGAGAESSAGEPRVGKTEDLRSGAALLVAFSPETFQELLEEVQVPEVGLPPCVEDVAEDRYRAGHEVDENVDVHSPDEHGGSAELPGFLDDIDGEAEADEVAEAGDETEQGIDPDPVARARDRESAVEEEREGPDPAQPSLDLWAWRRRCQKRMTPMATRTASPRPMTERTSAETLSMPPRTPGEAALRNPTPESVTPRSPTTIPRKGWPVKLAMMLPMAAAMANFAASEAFGA